MLRCLFAAAIGLVPMAALAETHVLTTWSALDEPDYVDLGPEGYSLGDLFTRHGLKLDGPNGAVLGEYFSQATVVHLDAEAGRSVRSYLTEVLLEGGSIFMMDLVELDHGQPADARQEHHGAVIGGTGVYSGIRGSFVLEVEDGIAIKTITYTLPED
jgi:hypothetical protein